MAAETAPGSPRHFLHPWRSEVLEPPGAAPVKTWKVCLSACFQPNAKFILLIYSAKPTFGLQVYNIGEIKQAHGAPHQPDAGLTKR